MQASEIKKVTIAGAGTMGAQIALQCARSGLDVTLYDISEERLESAAAVMKYLWNSLVKEGIGNAADLPALLERIQKTTNLETAGKDCDLINESIPENPELKGNLFASFHKICPARTIFTTNTSTLLPSMFADASGRPERLLALHFHKPLMVPAVTDVMPHAKTDPEVTKLVAEFAEIIGQVAMVPNKENSGYIFNYMLGTVLDAAMDLVINEVATVEQVDRSWMGIMKMGQGPFGIMDHIGLETVYTICNYWAESEKSESRRKRAAFVREYLERGHLGIKTGKGFYHYPHPAYQQKEFVEGKSV